MTEPTAWSDTPGRAEPVAATSSPEQLDRDQERVFERSWLPVARLSDLPDHGSRVRVDVGRRRWLLVRDGERIGALVNVCPHRGSLLLEAEHGCDRQVRCPYHGLTYDLDGALLSDAQAFGFGAHADRLSRLSPLRAETWGGWVWVCADPEAAPLTEHLGELATFLGQWSVAGAERKHRVARDTALSWRLAVEGFLEPLHIPITHRRTVHPVLDFRKGRVALLGDHSFMTSPWKVPDLYEPTGALGRQAASVGIEAFPELSEEGRRANHTVLLFPNLTLNLQPNHFTALSMWPIGPRRTRVVHEIYGLPASDEAQRAWYDTLSTGYLKVLDEDLAALASIQEGHDSGASGTVLSMYESRIAHFHDRLAAWHAR